MMEQAQHDVREWVSLAPDSGQREMRQAMHTVLAAIARNAHLRAGMIIKGGILLAVQYQSGRFTRDIDFSTPLHLGEVDPDTLRQQLDHALISAVEQLDYDLDCRVQGCKVQPPNRPEATFPSIQLKIGYAYKGTPKHRKLLQNQSPTVISIDYSLNEVILGEDQLAVGPGQSINAYTFADLVAEKFRALLQQVERNRYRRQDIYDLAMLSRLPADEGMPAAIHDSLIRKSRSRGLDPQCDSLGDPEVKRRAAADYQTLQAEIQGELPDFETAYAEVVAFYQRLPWVK